MANLLEEEQGNAQSPSDEFSFGALLERFFESSPLGKDLIAAQKNSFEKKGQELFIGNDAHPPIPAAK